MNPTKAISKAIQISLLLVLTVIMLYYGKAVLVPLAIACVLSMLFTGLSNSMEKKGLPRWASALICVVVMLVCAAGLGFLLNWQIQSFAEQVSTMKQNFQQTISNFQEWIESRLGVDQATQDEMAEKQMDGASNDGGMVQQVISGFFGIAVDTVLVIVYTFLLLLYRSRLKNFILKIVPTSERERSIDIMSSASQVAGGYVSGLAKMIVVLWVLYGVGFTAIGVENAIFFAVLCGLLELIPFIGNLLGTLIAILGVTAQGGDTNMILGVVGIYLFVQFIQTYLLEPLVVGNEVNINPLFTILCLVAAEAVWGIAGMLLAIPATGVLKILFDRIPPLQPYGYLIGTDSKKKRKSGFWKRDKKEDQDKS